MKPRDMTSTESAEYYGEAGTNDHLDEPDDTEPGMTVREAGVVRGLEATRKIRSRIYKALRVERGR